MNSRRRLVAIVLGSVLAVTCTTAARLALAGDRDHTSGAFDPYLHRSSGALADPVNLIFRGSLSQAEQAVPRVLGWQPVQGSMMVFYDHGEHVRTGAQFGLNLPGGSRFHLRLEAVTGAHGASYVLAGVHRDDLTACGHVGRAFNAARDLVAGQFAQAGYTVTREYLGNTTPGRQCDGSFTAGDGAAAVIDLTGTVRPSTASH
ncbi:MAG TPA: hypothetical protein VFD32_14135 [Dehalococcoidia bacterium]|nr:hypothetical protein [Dehalococcoidia bacterium]